MHSAPLESLHCARCRYYGAQFFHTPRSRPSPLPEACRARGQRVMHRLRVQWGQLAGRFPVRRRFIVASGPCMHDKLVVGCKSRASLSDCMLNRIE